MIVQEAQSVLVNIVRFVLPIVMLISFANPGELYGAIFLDGPIEATVGEPGSRTYTILLRSSVPDERIFGVQATFLGQLGQVR
ncbi:MAG: hypothetical protein KDA37_00425, partial [Planctomycetales bacterium]|nr:hypothetical protein [Planctomycetales bacterium]